jgi:hypothetical protein
VTLDDIVGLVRNVAQSGARHVIFKFAEQVTGNRKILFDRLKNLPGVDKFDSYMSQMIGGVYTVEERLRREWLTELLRVSKEVGITISTCYEYYNDKAAGSNMAPWFTTSDQCHGQGVPIFYRQDLSEPFKPLPGCYRKGCLYCAEHGTQTCKSEKLLMATALTYKDLRIKLIEGEHLHEDWYMWGSCAQPQNARNNAWGMLGIGHNPCWQTDAEMWGLSPLPELEVK